MDFRSFSLSPVSLRAPGGPNRVGKARLRAQPRGSVKEGRAAPVSDVLCRSPSGC